MNFHVPADRPLHKIVSVAETPEWLANDADWMIMRSMTLGQASHKGGLVMKLGYKALLDQANAEIEAISPQDAAVLLEDSGTIFVDLRDPRELQREGKIPGATHCPRGMLEFWIDPESPYHKPIFASSKTFIF